MAVHSRSRRRPVGDAVRAVSSGLLLSLSQPDIGLWPLAGVCIVPLLSTFRCAPLRRRLFHCWIAITVATLITCVAPGRIGISAYFGLSAIPSWGLAFAAAQIIGCVSFGVFGLLAPTGRGPSSVAFTLRVMTAWCAGEFARHLLPGSVPWMLLAFSLAPVPDLAVSASVGGAMFVSAWISGLNAAVLCMLRTRSLGATVSLAVPIALAGFPWLIPSAPERASEIRVSLVQSNLSNEIRNHIGGAPRALSALVEATRLRGPVDLAVWPETAVSAVLPFNQPLVANALESIDDFARFVLFGALRIVPESGDLRNSAVLLGPNREIAGIHDKVVLLPFGEIEVGFISRWLGSPPVMSAGAGPRTLEVGSVHVGPLICYEILFPALARAQVRGGANILVNLSNESYWGDSSALNQLLSAAVFRAIEQHRPVLRSTTTGVTAVIDERGRVLEQLPPYELGVITRTIQGSEWQTLYSRIGDAVPWLCVLVATAARAAEYIRERA